MDRNKIDEKLRKIEILRKEISEKQFDLREIKIDLVKDVLDAGLIDCLTVNETALRREFNRR